MSHLSTTYNQGCYKLFAWSVIKSSTTI